MAVDNRLQIGVSNDGEVLIVTLNGELDLASVEEFAAQMEQVTGEGLPVVVDLRGLDFIDSMGLRSVLTAHERHSELEQPFAVIPGSRQVGRLMDMTRISEHVRTVSSPQEITR